jgi:hypothetical protein
MHRLIQSARNGIWASQRRCGALENRSGGRTSHHGRDTEGTRIRGRRGNRPLRHSG